VQLPEYRTVVRDWPGFHYVQTGPIHARLWYHLLIDGEVFLVPDRPLWRYFTLLKQRKNRRNRG